MKRSSTVIWHGNGKEGSGQITSQSKALEKSPYAYGSRFADQKGTNPEELLAAAHAGCFTMKLSFMINEAGFTADSIETTSTVTLDKDTLTESHLKVKAQVDGMSEKEFDELAEKTKMDCPVSKALNMKITMDAQLVKEYIHNEPTFKN